MTGLPIRIRIEGIDLPGGGCGPSPERPGGHHSIHVGVQRKNRPGELLGLTAGTVATVTWTLDCTALTTTDGYDVTGPYVSGRPSERFIYLSWGEVNDHGGFDMFRRAKLWLDVVPTETIASAVDQGYLVGRLGLTDPKGNPICAAVRPPLIQWSAAAT